MKEIVFDDISIKEIVKYNELYETDMTGLYLMFMGSMLANEHLCLMGSRIKVYGHKVPDPVCLRTITKKGKNMSAVSLSSLILMDKVPCRSVSPHAKRRGKNNSE